MWRASLLGVFEISLALNSHGVIRAVRVTQTSTLIFVVRLFSADWRVEPVALAPGTFGTEATYCPFDSWTLPL